MSERVAAPAPAAPVQPVQPRPMGPAEASGPPPPAAQAGPVRSRTPSDTPQPGSPSATSNPPPPDRAPSPAARDADGPPATSGGWLDRLLGRPSSRADAETRSGSPPPADDAPTRGPATDPEAAAPAAPAAALPPKVQQAYDLMASLSFEEQAALAARDGPFQRLAQGFVDKAQARVAKQQADQSRQAQVQQLVAYEAQLRHSGDPLDRDQSAEVRNQIEAYQAQQTALTEIWQMHDRLSIDPALARLDEATAGQLRASVGPGLEGRQAMVEAVLDAYKSKVSTETEARLRKDPRFRKQVLAEARGGYLPDVPPDDEPQVFANGVGHRSPVSPTDQMNAWLRGQPRGAAL